MNCRICGTPIKAGEGFCSLCGEKAEFAEPQKSQAQQPFGQQAYREQQSARSYEQQPYRRSDRQQPYTQQPYAQQSYEQPFNTPLNGNMYYGSQKRSKKWVWITLVLVTVAAMAAILVFYVFGNKQGTQGKPAAAPPFKGDTPQTQFANDTAKVLSDSFAIFGDVGIDLSGMSEKPFEMKLDLRMKGMGEDVSGTVSVAYDNETFGMNISTEGITGKAQCIEDIMYAEVYGRVFGYDLHSSEDLSQPMTLKDRMMALGFYAQQSMPGETDYMTLSGFLLQSTFSGGKNTDLAGLLLNSIDESCFENSVSKTTLTLHAGDIADTLRTFAGKLEDNEELKKMYEDFIKETSGNSVDAISQLSGLADALEGQKETADPVIVWEVSYINEKPVSFIITAEKYVYSLSCKQSKDTTEIIFESTPGSSSESVSGSCSFKKAGSGTEISGTMITQGTLMSFYGDIAFSGNNTHGTITMKTSGSSNLAYGLDVTIDFNLTVDIRMPHTKVKDDGRFKIDTSGATIIDGSSLLGTTGLPGM